MCVVGCQSTPSVIHVAVIFSEKNQWDVEEVTVWLWSLANDRLCSRPGPALWAGLGLEAAIL